MNILMIFFEKNYLSLNVSKRVFYFAFAHDSFLFRVSAFNRYAYVCLIYCMHRHTLESGVLISVSME